MQVYEGFESLGKGFRSKVVKSFEWLDPFLANNENPKMGLDKRGDMGDNVLSEEAGKLKALIKRYERLKDLALARAQAMRDVERAIEEVRGELKDVKALLTKRCSKGGLLVSLGLACLAFPEPVFSNAAGAALIALGRLLERRTAGLEDLAEALREVRSVLGSREIKVSL